MAVTFSDNFNRADGALGTDWANLTGTKLTIASNSITSPDSGTNHTATVATVSSADAYSELTITTVGGSTSMGIGVRLQSGTETGYVWRYNGTNCQLFSVSAGSFSAIGSAYTATLTAPFTLRLECQGTAIRGYVDGVQRASTTSSVTTGAGRGSCRLQGTGVRGDNFSMGTIAPPEGTATGTFTFTGTATGTTTKSGTASGTYTFTGAAVGATVKSGTASGAWGFAGSASGSTVKSGTATGTTTWTGTAVGAQPAPPGEGTATGTWGFVGTVHAAAGPDGFTIDSVTEHPRSVSVVEHPRLVSVVEYPRSITIREVDVP